ncbi:MAG: dTDP-4-dehydrorhamnose reductase [Proteobacteria bacterium]|nr:dTDP-4-dehydrorhamnose reductase [Pseudomonadota bacterium]
MKILLLGANGQVGFELARSLAPLGELVCATRPGTLPGGVPCLSTDIASAASLAATLDATMADVIVNAAAYTAVDRAEDEPDSAHRANAQALAEIGAHAASHSALVVHYSTDYVFDGAGSRPYRENDATAPLGVYGHSKLAGENALRESGCAHLVLRTAWVYAARGHNFLRTMLRLAREREELRIVGDQRGAPTPARLIAAATATTLARLLARRAGERDKRLGTYHLCAAGQCTWFDFAGTIFARARAANLIERVPKLVPVTTAEYPTPARRPAYSVLDCSKIRDAFGLHLPTWQQGLDAVIGELSG